MSDGWVAKTSLGAALVGDRQRQAQWAATSTAFHRQRDDELIVIDHLLAEILVVFDLAFRKFWSADVQRRGLAAHLDAVAVQVVAGGDDPVQAHALGTVGVGT